MTRLHYPREFRQQSPAVTVEKKKKNQGVLTQKDGFWRSLCHEPGHQKCTRAAKMARFPEPLGLRSGFTQWANQRSTPCSPASSPRRYGEYKTRPRNGPFLRQIRSEPVEIRRGPTQNPIPGAREVVRRPVCRQAFSLVLGRDA